MDSTPELRILKLSSEDVTMMLIEHSHSKNSVKLQKSKEIQTTRMKRVLSMTLKIT